MTCRPCAARAIFFDAGHTLLYAYPDLGTVYAETTARFGVRLAPQAFMDAFVPTFREHAKRAEAEAASDVQDYALWRDVTRSIHRRLEGLPGIDFDRWFRALYERFGEPEVWRLYDDVEPALAALRRAGLRLGVVSNWDTRLRRICAGTGLEALVDFIVISAEVGVRKPHPRIFEAALRKAGVGPRDALHVGDLPDEDVEGARRAGLRAVLIDRQRRVAALGPSPGVPVLRSLLDLPSLL